MTGPEPGRLAALWRRVTGEALPEARDQEWTARHGEWQRHYHDGRHIAECLAHFDGVREQVKAPDEVELALFFHDSVYDPKAVDNEEKSAELARDWLNGFAVGEGVTAGVVDLILATKRHQPGTHPDGPWLLDIDLAILGADEARFREYEAQIAREYAWVPRATYREKRAQVLASFLGRPRIYFTDWFASRCEARARKNLSASIAALGEGEP